MKNAGVIYALQQEYRKWLRFYLDFCDKYYLAPSAQESLAQFIKKLNEKGQTLGKQKQAVQSVNVYLDILAQEPQEPQEPLAEIAKEKVSAISSPADEKKSSHWSTIFKNLNDSIRIRNYSKKTFRAYAGWIDRFATFIKHKSPKDIIIEDVKLFLTDLAVKQNVAATTQNQAFNALLFLFSHFQAGLMILK